MDGLTDILTSVRLKGALNFTTNLRAPWGIDIPTIQPAMFHVISRGSAWIHMKDMPPVFLSSGDLIVFTRGAEHTISDSPDSAMASLDTLLAAKQSHQGTENFVFGGDGAETTLICGKFDFESHQTHPLFSMMPELLHIPGHHGRIQSWLETSLAWIEEESRANEPGNETVIAKLAEILFIQVIRCHIASLKEGEGGWLGGLRDIKISTALGLMHRYPEKAWTIELFAEQLGMSRTAFTSRFRHLVGISPIAYLTQWRMYKAATLLREGNIPINQISMRLGYQAEAAFSKRFKSATGQSPRDYRNQNGTTNQA